MNIRAQANWRAGSWAKFEAAVVVPRLLVAARDAANIVLADSQGRVPVRTGDLQASGQVAARWTHQKVQGLVFYTMPYAAFVEFGTGIHGRGTYPYNLPQVGVPITGSWIYDYKAQNWIGMHARPYLRPALDSSRQPALDAFRTVLGQLGKVLAR